MIREYPGTASTLLDPEETGEFLLPCLSATINPQKSNKSAAGSCQAEVAELPRKRI